MMSLKLLLPIAVVAACASLLAACGGDDDATTPTSTTTGATGVAGAVSEEYDTFVSTCVAAIEAQLDRRFVDLLRTAH